MLPSEMTFDDSLNMHDNRFGCKIHKRSKSIYRSSACKALVRVRGKLYSLSKLHDSHQITPLNAKKKSAISSARLYNIRTSTQCCPHLLTLSTNFPDATPARNLFSTSPSSRPQSLRASYQLCCCGTASSSRCRWQDPKTSISLMVHAHIVRQLCR